MDSREGMTRIAHKNYRRLVFAFSDSGTMRFLRRWNPIPLPTSPLKGEVLRKFPSEREEE
jgi:hypothetical protein